MKNILIAATLLLLPVTAQAQRGDQQAINAAVNLTVSLDNLNFEASNLLRNAQNPGVRQRAQQVEQGSRQLSRRVNNQILSPLQRGVRSSQVRQNLNSLEPSLDSLIYEAQSFRAPAAGRVERAGAEVGQALNRLRRQLNDGPGPGPGPRPGHYEATCRVVLETIFGNDIRDFYGFASAQSEAISINAARQDGQAQCNAARSGLMKCSVASCDASFVR